MESGAMKVKMEVDIAEKLLSINILGLLDTAVQKLRGRVEAAVKNYSFSFVVCKIIINLTRGSLCQEVSRFCLHISVGMLTVQ